MATNPRVEERKRSKSAQLFGEIANSCGYRFRSSQVCKRALEMQTKSGGVRLAQRDTRQFGGATEAQREARPQCGTVVDVQRHSVDFVSARDIAGVGARD